MKIPSFKIAVLLVFGIVQLNAQKSKTHKEEFKVAKDVVIDIDTRHSDIEIETWNKNKVVIEACMTIDGKDISDEKREDLFKKWDFEAVGNSGKVKVKSRTNSLIDLNEFDFDTPNYAIYTDDLVDFSLGSLDVLDSMDFVMPPLPVDPFGSESDIMYFDGDSFEINTDFDFKPVILTEFDFDAYKKDKGYLKKWKEENKDMLGKNTEVIIGDNAISITGNDTNIMMLKEKKKFKKEIEKARKIYQKERVKAKEAYKKARLALEKERKKKLVKRKEALKKRAAKAKKSRKAIQKLLKNRSKLKVKRKIKIKAPKNAKFQMNVKYGALSFSK